MQGPQNRAAAVAKANEQALLHLATCEGNFFTTRERRFCVTEARKAFKEGCALCDSSVKPLHEHASYLAHGDDVLILIAHTAAKLQQKVSADWHAWALERVAKRINVQKDSGEAHVAFAELVVICAWAVGLEAFSFAMGVPLPAFPDEPTREIAPRRVPMRAVASESKIDHAYGWGPSLTGKLNETVAKEFTSIPGLVAGGPSVPFAHVTCNPLDTDAWTKWWDVLYIPNDSVVGQLWSAQLPDGYALKRPQIESVAAGLTGALHCQY